MCWNLYFQIFTRSLKFRFQRPEKTNYFLTLPALTNPLVLYSVPKCGPLRLRNVCKRGRSGRNWGRVRALLMMMVPKECPIKLTFVGFRPDVSMWCRISATSRSVIVSKSENVSPFSCNIEICNLLTNVRYLLSNRQSFSLSFLVVFGSNLDLLWDIKSMAILLQTESHTNVYVSQIFYNIFHS